MILFFSGVGNTRLVARQLAALCHDRCLAIEASTPPLTAFCREDDTLVLCFPVYAWGPPLLVEEYLKRSQMEVIQTKPKRLYMVCTCGDDIGRTDRIVGKALRPMGLTFDGIWSVQMPNTYVALPGFDTDSKEVETEKLKAAAPTVKAIAESIAAGEQHILQVQPGGMPWLKSHVLRPLFNRFLPGPKRFRTDSHLCVGCGQCAKQCPTGNIQMTEHPSGKQPRWGRQCTHCLACYHHCPHGAIRYGRYTRNKGQYRPPQSL